MIRNALFLPLCMVALPANADTPLPDAVRDMLTAAIASGNEIDISAVARIAKETNPDAAIEIDTMVNSFHAEKSANHEKQVRSAGFFDIWGGKGEFGLFRSTGTTSEFGVSAGLNLVREGLRWKHMFRANADYRRANGQTSRERLLFAYEPRYQINGKSFTYSLMQYERDPFVGFDNRYSASVGVGYDVVNEAGIKLSADAGPSYRHVEYTEDGMVDRAGLRSSLDFNWQLSPTLTLRQNANGYVEKDKTSLSSLTALDAKIMSRLSARFSYNTDYESSTETTVESFDTLSKVTLVYDF